jgi:hypothetical protein
MKAYEGVDVYSHIFLTSALVQDEWSATWPGCFTTWERALGTHCIGILVDPRAGLDDVEKRKFLTLPGLELRLLARPARSQSLYRLWLSRLTQIVSSRHKCQNRGPVADNPVSYSGSSGFNSRLGYQLSWLRLFFFAHFLGHSNIWMDSMSSSATTTSFPIISIHYSHRLSYSTLQTASQTNVHLWSIVTSSHAVSPICSSVLLWTMNRLKRDTRVAQLSIVNIYLVQTYFMFFSSSVWCQSVWLDRGTWEAVNCWRTCHALKYVLY